jgi:chromosome segregation ATPase
LLRETSYDRALNIIESQKKLYEQDRTNYESQIQILQQSGESKQIEIKKLQGQLAEVNQKIQELDAKHSSIIKQQISAPSNLKIILLP